MNDFWSKARPWLMWPWRLMLVAAFAVSLFAAIRRLMSPAARADPTVAFYAAGLLVALGFSALLVVRGHRNRAALLLAVIMLMFGSRGVFGLVVVGSPLLDAPGLSRFVVGLLMIGLQMSFAYVSPIFALEITGGPYSRRQAWLVHGVAAAMAAVAGAFLLSGPFAEIFPQFPQIPQILPASGNRMALLILANQLFSFAVLAVNYARNDAATRNRIKIVLLAFVLNLPLQITLSQTFGSEPWTASAMVVLRFIMLALFAYAVLGQRLVDLGFAINRTLVYGAAAFTLLVTFGLVEYAAKSAIPAAWPDAGPFISAGIAVLLFLTFHRLHHWFEHHIERLFFRKWQEAEAALRRFVDSAGHFDKSPALCKAAADAVSRYAEGAGAALYVRGSDGAFGKEAGRLAGASKSYPDDDPAFALMRAERKPLELARAHGALPGELALPMLEQGNLIGFVLLALKPDGTHYRPDETELLDWAVHHIGLDLQALQARELRAQVALLSERNRLLGGERDRLFGLLAKGRPA